MLGEALACRSSPIGPHRSAEPVPTPPGWDFSRQSLAVLPNSPLCPPKYSRAAAVATPRFQEPSWLPAAAAASSGTALPALEVLLPLAWVQQARLQAGHSACIPLGDRLPVCLV